MKKRQKRKPPISNRTERVGIISPYGNLWTHETFDTKDEAKAHLEGFWRAMPRMTISLSRYKFVPVRLTVTVIQSK